MKALTKLAVVVFFIFSTTLISCGDELNKDIEDANIENQSFVDPATVKPPTGG